MPEVRPEFRAQEFPFEIGGHRRAAFGNNEQPLRVRTRTFDDPWSDDCPRQHREGWCAAAYWREVLIPEVSSVPQRIVTSVCRTRRGSDALDAYVERPYGHALSRK